MTEKIRFHLDENVTNAIAAGLCRRGIDVTTTPEVGLISKPDPEQLAFAVSQKRVLVTHDDDFIVLHRKGIKHSGIVYCKPNRRSIGEILNTLVLMWEIVEPEEINNHLEFI